MNALYALASAHLEYRGVDNVENSLSFHNHAIQGLARLIENNGKVNRNEVLATIMLLVYYEVVGYPKISTLPPSGLDIIVIAQYRQTLIPHSLYNAAGQI